MRAEEAFRRERPELAVRANRDSFSAGCYGRGFWLKKVQAASITLGATVK
jgi:hypothetical protein